MTKRKERWSAGFVPDDERERLRSTFGEALSGSRRAAGLTVKELAKRSGLSTSHIYALQNGSSRTRPVTIATLARAIAPDAAGRLEHELTVLAGESLRPDTPGGSRRRRRREERARRELPTIEAQFEVLMRKVSKLHADLAARRAVAYGVGAVLAGQPRQVDHTQARLELAALDRAFEAQQRQAEAQQLAREQKMMRGEL